MTQPKTPLQLYFENTDGHKFLLLDGPMGTMLPLDRIQSLLSSKEKEEEKSENPSWSVPFLRHKRLNHYISEIHETFLRESQSDILTTATYQLDSFSEENNGIEALELRAVELAKEQIEKRFPHHQRMNSSEGNPPFIAASISTLGASLPGSQEFSGKFVDSWEREKIVEFHRIKLEGFREAIKKKDVSLLLFETVPALYEAKCIAEALGQFFKDKSLPPVDCIISFSCKDGSSTCRGDSIADCASFVESEPLLTGMSINCTNPKFIPELLKQMKRCCPSKILMVYPNSGKVWDDATQTFKDTEYSTDEKRFMKWAPEWYKLGARIVGGCCTTLPRFEVCPKRTGDNGVLRGCPKKGNNCGEHMQVCPDRFLWQGACMDVCMTQVEKKESTTGLDCNEESSPIKNT